MDAERIGTIEILNARIYPLDPQTDSHPLSTSVFVPPGVYPVYRVTEAYYWIMTGRVNAMNPEKIGDGLFVMQHGDAPTGPEVTFPSRTYGQKEFGELLVAPVCTEGHPAQRLRFTLTEAVGAGR
jgi:hypothetical protein